MASSYSRWNRLSSFYSYVPTSLVGQPEEKSNTSYASIVVGISRTLEAIWNLSKDNLRKILFEYAKRHINARAVEKTLGGKSEIQLTTYSAPNQCPFDPDLINIDLKNPMQVNIPSENPIAKSEPASLASQIIDLRDSINAILGKLLVGAFLHFHKKDTWLNFSRTVMTMKHLHTEWLQLVGLLLQLIHLILKNM